MDWRDKLDKTSELYAVLEEMEKEKAENDGFFTSSSRCEGCGNYLKVRISYRPAHWESDITVITHEFKCLECASSWKEVDSD